MKFIKEFLLFFAKCLAASALLYCILYTIASIKTYRRRKRSTDLWKKHRADPVKRKEDQLGDALDKRFWQKMRNESDDTFY